MDKTKRTELNQERLLRSPTHIKDSLLFRIPYCGFFLGNAADVDEARAAVAGQSFVTLEMMTRRIAVRYKQKASIMYLPNVGSLHLVSAAFGPAHLFLNS